MSMASCIITVDVVPDTVLQNLGSCRLFWKSMHPENAVMAKDSCSVC